MANWYKHISNPPAIPWLTWIINGTKTFEGRLYKEDWAQMNVGDQIHFSSEGPNCVCTVVTLRRYDSFADAFDDLGQSLVPVPNILRADVIELYAKYYSEDDIRKFGVVAVEVEPVQSRVRTSDLYDECCDASK